MGLGRQFSLGWRWFSQSLLCLRLKPLGFTAIVIAYAMTMALSGAFPIVGVVLAGLFWPFGTVMVARAGKDTLEGQYPSFAGLRESFADRGTRLRLIRAGLLYAIMVVTISMAWSLLAAGDIAQWKVTEGDRVVWSSAMEHVPYAALAVCTLIYIPCMMALWFTPLLIFCKNMTLPKALFFSLVGCLRNFLAVVIALGLAFACFAVATAAMSAALIATGLTSVAVFAMLPVSLFGTALIYGTYYPMWRSVFSGITQDATRPNF